MRVSHFFLLRHFYLAFAWISLLSMHALSWGQAIFLQTSELPQGTWMDHSEALCEVASATKNYLQRGPDYDPAMIHGGRLPEFQTTPERIQDTLQFLCDIAAEDKHRGRASRLADADFIMQHFELQRWHPDRAKARQFSADKPLLQNLPEDQILLTKYYVRVAEGRTQPSAQFPHALYGLPFDEAELTLEQAERNRAHLTRYRYGKQTIVAQETAPNPTMNMPELAPPLVWLSRADLEGALLQGTAVVQDEQQQRYFNVHRNNGIAYDRALKPEAQQRYWYFKQVPGVLGYGKDAHFKIPVKPWVTVAGDIAQWGLGRVVLLRTQEHNKPVFRLTVMADTGGAFEDNLYQLDWLSGFYRDWKDYHAHNRHISDYADAWFLLKKQP